MRTRSGMIRVATHYIAGIKPLLQKRVSETLFRAYCRQRMFSHGTGGFVIRKKSRTQVKSAKKKRSVHDTNRLFLRQMNVVLNRKLKSMRKHMEVQHLELNQQWLKMMQVGSIPAREVPKVIYKELNVLLITPCNDREMSSHCVLIEQSLKHLVRNVNEIKYIESVSACLSSYDVDLIMVIGSGENLPDENITALRTSTVKKAIWLSADQQVNQSETILPIFDHVFTQQSTQISDDQHHMGSTGSHELFMPPDPHIFCPQAVPRSTNRMFISSGMQNRMTSSPLLPNRVFWITKRFG